MLQISQLARMELALAEKAAISRYLLRKRLDGGRNDLDHFESVLLVTAHSGLAFLDFLASKLEFSLLDPKHLGAPLVELPGLLKVSFRLFRTELLDDLALEGFSWNNLQVET